MKNSLLQEIVVSAVLIVLLIAFLNPLSFWMPTGLLMMMVLGLIIVFAVFVSFIWRENARDEREGVHRMFAGRLGFIVGAGVLVVGIIVRSLEQKLDFWLVITLSAMVLAKIIGLIYSQRKH